MIRPTRWRPHHSLSEIMLEIAGKTRNFLATPASPAQSPASPGPAQLGALANPRKTARPAQCSVVLCVEACSRSSHAKHTSGYDRWPHETWPQPTRSTRFIQDLLAIACVACFLTAWPMQVASSNRLPARTQQTLQAVAIHRVQKANCRKIVGRLLGHARRSQPHWRGA